MVLIKSGHRLVTSDTAWGAGGGGERGWAYAMFGSSLRGLIARRCAG